MAFTETLSKWNQGIGKSDQVESKHPKLPTPGRRNILISAALPYVNNVPHLGNIIGCVLSGDVFSRYCRLRGYQSLFVSGTDEYGTATETKALEEGLTPQQISDKYHKIHREVYDWFNIDFDYFGRTTTAKQTEVAQSIFWKVHAAGHLVERTTEQLHCGKCDRFLADRYVFGLCPLCGYEDARGDQCDGCSKLLNATELKDPRCHTCKARPQIRSSDHLFLDLPALEPALVAYLEATWAVEANNWSTSAVGITKSWLKEGLKERCITRDLKWGTPVPLKGFQGKVFYVWFDAPIGYISMTASYTSEWERWWKAPGQVEYYNFVGKDNVPFHSVIFPCSLIATGDDWTKVTSLCATEYLNYEDAKFSKRLGVGIFGNDAAATGIPADVWRFYLLYVRPEGQDTAFSWDDFALKINSELLNNLGNFVNRSLSFLKSAFGSVVPDMALEDGDCALLNEINTEVEEYCRLMEAAKLRDGIRCILNISRLGNQYIQTNQPWVLVKGSAEENARGGTVIGLAANISCLLAVLLRPYMPGTSDIMKEQLGVDESVFVIKGHVTRCLPTGHRIGEPKPLFAKLEAAKAAEFKAQFAGNQAARENTEKAKKSNGSPAKKPAKSPKKEKTNTAEKMEAKAEANMEPRKDAPAWLKALAKTHEESAALLAQIDGEYKKLCSTLEKEELPALKKENGELRRRVSELKKELVAAETANGVTQVTVPKPSAAKPAPQAASAPIPSAKQEPAVAAASEKKPKKEKKGGGEAKAKAPDAAELPVDVSRLDLRIGFISEAKRHPDAESLYVETVDCGEEKPRNVVSGLVKHIPIEEMQQRLVVVMCNLKPAKMRGVESQAMVMCASTPDKVEILRPPPGARPGDRVSCPAFPGSPDAQLNPKKKVWEAVAPDLKVDAEGRVVFKDALLEVNGEHITAPSLKSVQVK